MQIEDVIILLLILGMVVFALNKRSNSPIPIASDPPKSGAALKLLNQHDFEIVAGKCRLPIGINFDEQSYESRILIDYIVKKNGKTYIVKTKNKRKQERISGSFLRDEFLKVQVVFQADGILYLDLDKNKIHEVYFDYPTVKTQKSWIEYFQLPKWLMVTAVAIILFLILR